MSSYILDEECLPLLRNVLVCTPGQDGCKGAQGAQGATGAGLTGTGIGLTADCWGDYLYWNGTEWVVGSSNITLGCNAGQSNQGILSVALGNDAGRNNQGDASIAIGAQAGLTGQKSSSIAIGALAGQNNQGLVGGTGAIEGNAIAIGSLAGQTNQGNQSIAMGLQSGLTGQKSNAIAIGSLSGQINQGVGAIAIGSNAGQSEQNTNSIAIGNLSGYLGQTGASIAIGLEAGTSNQGTGPNPVGPKDGHSISIGIQSGSNYQTRDSIAIGYQAGQTGQGTGTNPAYGNAPDQGRSIAIGYQAGQNNQGFSSVGIGSNAAKFNQGPRSVALGEGAGFTGQGIMCVAIGTNAGSTNQSATNNDNRFGSVAIGAESGSLNQFANSVCIGVGSGTTVQNQNCVAIGNFSQNNNPVDNSSQGSVAIGYNAQNIRPANSPGAIAIGFQSGGSTQGAYSIAIGYGATNSTSNSIILAANGGLNAGSTGFYVNPIRSYTAGGVAGNSVLRYGSPYGNASEITVDTSVSDSRIKTNIENLNDSECLNIVENIEPKKYNYKINPNGTKVYGFIAQDVEQYLPYAVPNTTKYIPNIYAPKTFEILEKENSTYTLYLNDIVSSDIIIDDTIKIIYRENDVRVKVLEVLQDKIKVVGNFYTDIDSSVDSSLFVFGKEINDFKGLDKEMLLPVLWSAFQELLKKYKNLEQTVSNLQTHP